MSGEWGRKKFVKIFNQTHEVNLSHKCLPMGRYVLIAWRVCVFVFVLQLVTKSLNVERRKRFVSYTQTVCKLHSFFVSVLCNFQRRVQGQGIHPDLDWINFYAANYLTMAVSIPAESSSSLTALFPYSLIFLNFNLLFSLLYFIKYM